MPEAYIPELAVPFFFRRRPTSVPGDLRPLWRIHVLLLLLRMCCRQNRSSFARLHVLSWATLSSENRSTLLDIVDGGQPLDAIVVRVEPSLNRAVDYAIGEGVVRRTNGDRYELTPRGVEVADGLNELAGCLEVERRFMAQLGKRVTEQLVNTLFA